MEGILKGYCKLRSISGKPDGDPQKSCTVGLSFSGLWEKLTFCIRLRRKDLAQTKQEDSCLSCFALDSLKHIAH